MIDKRALLAWLRTQSLTKAPLVGAIYAGLVARLERGDFDQKEEGTPDA